MEGLEGGEGVNEIYDKEACEGDVRVDVKGGSAVRCEGESEQGM